LRLIINTPGTHGAERATATKNRDRRRAASKGTPRIPQVVAQQQEKITSPQSVALNDTVGNTLPNSVGI